jgi:hypothetical protein
LPWVRSAAKSASLLESLASKPASEVVRAQASFGIRTLVAWQPS